MLSLLCVCVFFTVLQYCSEFFSYACDNSCYCFVCYGCYWRYGGSCLMSHCWCFFFSTAIDYECEYLFVCLCEWVSVQMTRRYASSVASLTCLAMHILNFVLKHTMNERLFLDSPATLLFIYFELVTDERKGRTKKEKHTHTHTASMNENVTVTTETAKEKKTSVQKKWQIKNNNRTKQCRKESKHFFQTKKEKNGSNLVFFSRHIRQNCWTNSLTIFSSMPNIRLKWNEKGGSEWQTTHSLTCTHKNSHNPSLFLSHTRKKKNEQFKICLL